MENLSEFLALVFFAFLFSIKRNYISNGFILILWNFAGVFLHEISHYIVALIFNAKPKLPNLIPERKKIYIKDIPHYFWKLGYVEVRNLNRFNAFFIGLAPVFVLLPIAYIVYSNFFLWFEYSIKNVFLFYFSLFIILYNALPSKADLIIAVKGFYGLFVFVIGGVIISLLFS